MNGTKKVLKLEETVVLKRASNWPDRPAPVSMLTLNEERPPESLLRTVTSRPSVDDRSGKWSFGCSYPPVVAVQKPGACSFGTTLTSPVQLSAPSATLTELWLMPPITGSLVARQFCVVALLPCMQQ